MMLNQKTHDKHLQYYHITCIICGSVIDKRYIDHHRIDCHAIKIEIKNRPSMIITDKDPHEKKL